MTPDEKAKAAAITIAATPLAAWFIAAKQSIDGFRFSGAWLVYAAQTTPQRPVLIGSLIAGLLVSIGIVVIVNRSTSGGFSGAPFKTFLRGTEVVSARRLSAMTRESGQQISVGGVPMPEQAKTTHLLVSGSPGSGKSVLLRSAVYSAKLRGDRTIIVDPDGDMLQKFWRPGDKILNALDARTEGWSMINEIRKPYDWTQIAKSIVPLKSSHESEEWAEKGRQLISCTARRLQELGDFSIESLYQWSMVSAPKDYKKLLEGTDAAGLFVEGADRALGGARFTINDALAAHRLMPVGNFSLRDWLANDTGSLFITYRKDMLPTLRPLITAWLDILCSAILSSSSTNPKTIWMWFDELASLHQLPRFAEAAAEGRKYGLCIVAALQSIAQLNDLYGHDKAQAILSCFRSFAVLAGSKMDPQTCEAMSKALGTHEVERDKTSRTSGRNRSTSTSIEVREERVVSPTQIASLKPLTGYVGFAGMSQIAPIQIRPQNFKNRIPSFMEA